MLAFSSRSDCAFTAKMLNSRYGKATKSDLTTAIKLIKQAKAESTDLTSPNLGNSEDWLFVGISDASNKTEVAAVIH